MVTRNSDVVDWTSIWRLVRVGGLLIAGAFAAASLSSRLHAIDTRVQAIETHGSIPLQLELRVLRDSVNAVRRAQVLNAADYVTIQHLLCRVPSVATDSQCTARGTR